MSPPEQKVNPPYVDAPYVEIQDEESIRQAIDELDDLVASLTFLDRRRKLAYFTGFRGGRHLNFDAWEVLAIIRQDLLEMLGDDGDYRQICPDCQAPLEPKPIEEILAKLAKDIPQEEWDRQAKVEAEAQANREALEAEKLLRKEKDKAARQRHNSPGYWINDTEALMRIYLAAKANLLHSDACSRGLLALIIKEAEDGPQHY